MSCSLGYSHTSPARAFFYLFIYLPVCQKQKKKSTKAASPKITAPTKCGCWLACWVRVCVATTTTTAATSGHNKKKAQRDKTETLPGHWLKTTSCLCSFLCWRLHSSSRRGRATQPSGRQRCFSTRAPDWPTQGGSSDTPVVSPDYLHHSHRASH